MLGKEKGRQSMRISANITVLVGWPTIEDWYIVVRTELLLQRSLLSVDVILITLTHPWRNYQSNTNIDRLKIFSSPWLRLGSSQKIVFWSLSILRIYSLDVLDVTVSTSKEYIYFIMNKIVHKVCTILLWYQRYFL